MPGQFGSMPTNLPTCLRRGMATPHATAVSVQTGNIPGLIWRRGMDAANASQGHPASPPQLASSQESGTPTVAHSRRIGCDGRCSTHIPMTNIPFPIGLPMDSPIPPASHQNHARVTHAPCAPSRHISAFQTVTPFLTATSLSRSSRSTSRPPEPINLQSRQIGVHSPSSSAHLSISPHPSSGRRSS